MKSATVWSASGQNSDSICLSKSLYVLSVSASSCRLENVIFGKLSSAALYLWLGQYPVMLPWPRGGVEHYTRWGRQWVVASLLHHSNDVNVQACLVNAAFLKVDARELAISQKAETSCRLRMKLSVNVSEVHLISKDTCRRNIQPWLVKEAQQMPHCAHPY